jgi:hypothetical protein
MNAEDQDIQDDEVLNRLVAQLAEHFEVVQVFVSNHSGADNCCTVTAARGMGNYNARLGMVWKYALQEKRKAEGRADEP